MVKKAIIVYATGSGNAQLVAEATCDGLTSAGVESTIIKAELTNVEELKNYGLIVLICSTWDVGRLNPNFIRLNTELKKSDLTGYYTAIIGLGDSAHYDIFCGAADEIEATINVCKLTPLIETLRLDGPPHKILPDLKKRGEELGRKFLSLS